MTYTPNLKSVRKHKVPEWFHDAKFGIFIHWSLSSVPAFAVVGQGDLVEIQKKEGIGAQFAKNPYAEWYLNSLRIDGTETQKYHRETYGENFSYDDFVPIFNKAIKKWNPNEWVDLFKKVGAKYVILVTKHHDGFLLWPSKYPNPRKKNYSASRDIVGELTKVVKRAGLKMGLYYSGSLDWSFTETPIIDIISFLDNGPTEPEYVEYVSNHFYELIDKYEPIILWNDIGYPPKTNVNELFAYFYNKFPDGIVNDRWIQISKFTRKLLKFKPIAALIKWIVKRLTSKGSVSFPISHHYDFQTPEYMRFKEIRENKWEITRGIGFSFGYNKFEPKSQYLTLEELIYMFVDIVSKNGNLLLNVGPMEDGTIPEIQKNLLLKFGKWLEVNGDAIFGTRPWIRAESKTVDNMEIRYTQKENVLYAILLGKLKTNTITIKSLNLEKNAKIQILDNTKDLNWKNNAENLEIEISRNLLWAPAYVFKIKPKPIK